MEGVMYMLIIALLLIGLAIWLLGVVLMIIGGLPIIFMVGKFLIEALVGITIYKLIKKKIQEKQQHEMNKGL
jgi:membrane protein implicated in regulation of membrane protease activity